MTTTPNMNIVLPTVSVTVGPTWATEINAGLTNVDAHDHSTGKGIAITPSGLNISSDLTFAQNNATNLRTVRFYNNSAFTGGSSDKGCFYELNNELHFIDGAGNDVQITLNGAIDVSASISSLTINDSAFIVQYFGDNSRKFKFDASGITTGTTRTYVVPDANDTFVMKNTTDTLTHKTFDSTSVATGIKIASFTPDGTHTITSPSVTDTMTVNGAAQTLALKTLTAPIIATIKPDGSAVNTLQAVTDTFVYRASTDTLTNKTFTAPLQTSYETFTEISTPSNPASGKLAIYAKSDNNLYSLNSAGLEQQIGASGGSSGGINYISNGGFENGTVSGWITYSGGTTTPTSGTGGSPVSTFAIDSSSMLRGTYAGLWTKSANNRQGEGFSYAFTMAVADLGKTLQITFDALASAGMVSGDMTIYIYDVTNSVLITPSSINVPTGTSSQYSLAFQATTGTSYRLIFHTSTTSATAYTLAVDQLSISPIVRPVVAGESDWISYIPTFSAGFGTVTNAIGYWKRIGDTISIIGSCTTGTVAGSVASISLPTIITSINASKLSISANTTSNPGNDVGAFSTGLANASCAIVTAPGTSTSVVYVGGLANGTSQLVPANGSTIAANATVCSFNFIVPISNWSSNITLASTAPMIEYVSNSSSADSADTTSFAYGASGSAGILNTTVLTARRNKRVRFQNAIQPTDRIQIEISADRLKWYPLFGTDPNTTISYFNIQNSGFYGIGIISTVVNTTDIDIQFGQYAYPNGTTYGAAGLAWTGTGVAYWRVAKYSSIGVAELAPATLTSTGTLPRYQDWVAYTPTFSAGFGTVTNASGFYKIIGDSLYVKVSCTTGTVAGSLGSITIPTTVTMSSAKLPISANTTGADGNIVGQYGFGGASTQASGPIVTAPGTSTTVVYTAQYYANAATGILIPQNVSTIGGSTRVFAATFEVPIV